MTLRFSTKSNNKIDTREIEYNQSIVELGLEKANLEREIGEARGVIGDLGKVRADINLDLGAKKEELAGYDTKLNEVREKIADALKNQNKDVVALKEEEKLVEKLIGQKKEEIEQLNQHITSLNTDIETKNIKLSELQQKLVELREELSRVSIELSEELRKLENAQSDTQAAHRSKAEALRILEAANRELDEVNAMIESLKRNNRGGLDALASLAAERARLIGREEAIIRKEADLLVYENRLAKRAKDLGVDLKMTFK